MLPKITIVTPSYNQANFLERTIISIISQSYQNFEYIIIDAQSKDGSCNIIQKYSKYLYYWCSEPDKGQSDGINKGFKKATGVWLCWVNADDILLPKALEKVAHVIEKNQWADIITGNIVYINEDDRIIKCIRVPKMRWFFYKRNVGYFCAPAVFFKKELFDKVGGLDVNLHYSMDIDLWHKFRLAGAKIYHINDYLGAFRVHSLSKTGPRIKREKRYFEHPETTLIRKKYLPHISKNTVRFFRMIYKLWQIINLNYVRAWIDLQKWKGKKWMEVFK